MDNIQNFRSVIPAERSEKIFRELIKKQAAGEIRTETQLREELEKQINLINTRGQITFEIPVRPGEIISSERMATFFKDVVSDIEILFVEVDHTDGILTRQTQIISTEIKSLQVAIGQLKAEGIQKKIRVKPGSGFTTISRDSFDRGYSDLAGRAETPYDFFQDDRSTGEIIKGEAIPIHSDARVEGIGKKLVLPSYSDINIGFKEIVITESATTSKGLSIDNIYPLYNAIDGDEDTFWSLTIGKKYPILGTPVPIITRVQGTSGLDPTVNFSGIIDTRPHDYYIKIVDFSGIYPVISNTATTESYIGPICQYDNGSTCAWDYTTLYSQNCINSNCSRYETDLTTVVSGTVALEDGFGYNTGATLAWSNFSGLSAGTTFKIVNQPSGTVGAVVELDLTLTTPGNINWIEIDPVADSQFSITKIEYVKPTESGRIQITSSSINVEDSVRLDIPAIEAEKIFLTINQNNYRKARLITNKKNTALNQIETLKQGPTEPTPSDTATIDLPILMEDYVRDPDVKEIFLQNDWTPEINDGYFYQVGLFEINCGLSSYSENAIAVSKSKRVFTPTMFGIQSNLEPALATLLSGTEVGTFEFSLIKFNYDSDKSLINIQDFPIPIVTSGNITERLFINDKKIGQTRFAATSVSGISDLGNSRTLSSSEFSFSTTNETVPKSYVAINRSDIGPSNILTVTYIPKYGIFLDEDKKLAIENNDDFQLSISEIQAIITSEPKIANRNIEFSDIFVRIIVRRNDKNSFNTPKLRDYQLLINEQDPNRFFV